MISSTVRQPYLSRKVTFFIVCANYDEFWLVMMKNGIESIIIEKSLGIDSIFR